jgi:hypothetical protein
VHAGDRRHGLTSAARKTAAAPTFTFVAVDVLARPAKTS